MGRGRLTASAVSLTDSVKVFEALKEVENDLWTKRDLKTVVLIMDMLAEDRMKREDSPGDGLLSFLYFYLDLLVKVGYGNVSFDVIWASRDIPPRLSRANRVL